MADALNLLAIITPTLARTDTPCSALSVIDSEGGSMEGFRFCNRHPPDDQLQRSAARSVSPGEFSPYESFPRTTAAVVAALKAADPLGRRRQAPFEPAPDQPVGVERLMAAIEAVLPAAVGAWGACPERQPVVLLGDGALLMCSNELATLARHAIPALVIVLDNGGYGTERPIVDGPFNDLQLVAHRELALAMGFSAAERVANEEELWSCLSRWRSNGLAGPMLNSVAIPTGAMSAALWRLSTALGRKVASSTWLMPSPGCCSIGGRSSW